MNAYTTGLVVFCLGSLGGAYFTALYYITQADRWRTAVRASRPLIINNPTPMALEERIREELRSVAQKWGVSVEEAADKLGLPAGVGDD